MYHNGEWGTVCEHFWDIMDAQVVCSELGFGKAATVFAFYGQGSGPVWLGLACKGTEQTIGDCAHLGWGENFCDHSKDVGIRCYQPVGKSIFLCVHNYIKYLYVIPIITCNQSAWIITSASNFLLLIFKLH